MFSIWLVCIFGFFFLVNNHLVSSFVIDVDAVNETTDNFSLYLSEIPPSDIKYSLSLEFTNLEVKKAKVICTTSYIENGNRIFNEQSYQFTASSFKNDIFSENIDYCVPFPENSNSNEHQVNMEVVVIPKEKIYLRFVVLVTVSSDTDEVSLKKTVVPQALFSQSLSIELTKIDYETASFEFTMDRLFQSTNVITFTILNGLYSTPMISKDLSCVLNDQPMKISTKNNQLKLNIEPPLKKDSKVVFSCGDHNIIYANNKFSDVVFCVHAGDFTIQNNNLNNSPFSCVRGTDFVEKNAMAILIICAIIFSILVLFGLGYYYFSFYHKNITNKESSDNYGELPY